MFLTDCSKNCLSTWVFYICIAGLEACVHQSVAYICIFKASSTVSIVQDRKFWKIIEQEGICSNSLTYKNNKRFTLLTGFLWLGKSFLSPNRKITLPTIHKFHWPWRCNSGCSGSKKPFYAHQSIGQFSGCLNLQKNLNLRLHREYWFCDIYHYVTLDPSR